MQMVLYHLYTVNVEIFAHYIFLRILPRAVDARKFDVMKIIITIEQIELTGACIKIKIHEYAP